MRLSEIKEFVDQHGHIHASKVVFKNGDIDYGFFSPKAEEGPYIYDFVRSFDIAEFQKTKDKRMIDLTDINVISLYNVKPG
ncbi:MAG: hypothetical protein JST70_16845 [Bacteroidetes bacterium]|nr:hypothetical protein [Bacteroidota bacterium]